MKCDFRGKLSKAWIDPETGKVALAFLISDKVSDAVINHLNRSKDLRIEVKRFHVRRSNDANALLWACIGDIARHMRITKEEVYEKIIRDYGQYTYLVCDKKAVESLKLRLQNDFRVVEEIGTIKVGNGEKEAVQLLCYYGSHLYTVDEFSVLLDGVKQEMEDVGLQPPPSADMRRCLEAMKCNQ